MIDTKTGTVLLDGVEAITPSLSFDAFLASPLGQGAQSFGVAADWPQFYVGQHTIFGDACTVIFLFHQQQLTAVRVHVLDPSLVDTTSEVNDFDVNAEEEALALKVRFEAWLAAKLGPPPYLYPWGTPYGQSLYSSIIVQTGTTNVLGGLQASGHTIVGTQLPGAGKVPDPPDARAYDAHDALLFSAHIAASGSSLTTVDVAGSLGGSPISTQVSLSGSTPSVPVAMVWSGSDRALFVLDKIGAALRLVRIATTGDCSEVWRTQPTYKPMSAFLGAGYNNGLVLALSTEQGSEVVLLDTNGKPRSSHRLDGVFFRAPVENAMGITLPMAQVSGGSRSNLRLMFEAHSGMSRGICDSPWLRAHATRDSSSPIARACGECPGSHDHDGVGDPDDGHD